MSRRSWGVVVAVVAGLAVGAPAASGQGGDFDPSTGTWTFSYGAGTIAPPWQAIQAPADRISVADSPTDASKKVMKVYLHQDDRYVTGGVGYNRAEVYARHGNPNDYSAWPDGDLTERWYTWSTYLPPDFPKVNKWAVILQWHGTAGGVPPLVVNVQNGQLQLNHMNGQLWHSASAETRGRWHTFMAHIRWGATPGLGFVDFWHNGVKVVSGLEKGNVATERCCAIQNGVPRPYPNYLKMGQYRALDYGVEGTLYHGPLRIYTKAEAVRQPTAGE